METKVDIVCLHQW